MENVSTIICGSLTLSLWCAALTVGVMIPVIFSSSGTIHIVLISAETSSQLLDYLLDRKSVIISEKMQKCPNCNQPFKYEDSLRFSVLHLCKSNIFGFWSVD